MFGAGFTGKPEMDQLSLAAVRRAQDALRVALPSTPQLSLINQLREAEGGNFGRTNSPEFRRHRELCERAGDLPPSRRILARIDAAMLRDMTVAGVSGSNYLAPTVAGEYIPALQDDSAALKLGAQVLSIPAGSASLAQPRGATAATTYWLSDENTQITETQPALGSVASTSKTVAALVQVSRQLLIQGANTESVVRTELRRAAAAALDAAVFAGTGAAGQPTGIVNTSGIGAFTGASLDQAALRNSQADLATAKAIVNPGALGYVTTPAVAELISKRQRFTGSDRALWEGPSHDGIVEGLRAISSANAPTATMILAEWSSCQIVEYNGGMVIEVDPFSGFSTGLINIRLLLNVDVMLLRAAAFSVATGVS